MTETEAIIVLNAIEGLTNRRIRKLLEYYGSALNILKESSNGLKAQSFLPEKVSENIVNFASDDFLVKEFSLINNTNIKIITYNDKDYPKELHEISDAPIVLYIKGEIPKESKSIAIVGSRRASVYGINVAEKFAMSLAEQGVTVISGLARGIDAAAHRGALKAKGMTVAVLGCGLLDPYPVQNQQLREEIAQSGAVISEFPLKTRPAPYNFPRRNRIVSGLSDGVIVVEAAKKSGALITADFALDQGRDVYAVPGSIDNPSSYGVHDLIKQGAKLVTSIEDVLEDLNIELKEKVSIKQDIKESKDSKVLDLSDSQKSIYNFIGDRPIHIDEIIEQSKASHSLATTVLVQLELKRMVKQLPGKRFTR